MEEEYLRQNGLESKMRDEKIRTLSQKRAEYSLKEVLDLKCNRKDFMTFSAGAPSMILKNGFGQTLAFWLSKGSDKDLKLKENDKHIILMRIVMRWLLLNSLINAQDEKTFLLKITEMSQKEYLLCQQETLKLLEWVKRFANAEL